MRLLASQIASLALLFCACLFPREGAAISPPSLKFLGPQGFVYPVMGPRRSSGYGLRVHPIKHFSAMHQGVDLAAPSGSFIRAISGGTVVFADPYAGYGNLVVIKHNKHVTTHYGHCETIRVRAGQHINPGEIIATVGSTGHSTGPHLHFELRVDGESLDPDRKSTRLNSSH